MGRICSSPAESLVLAYCNPSRTMGCTDSFAKTPLNAAKAPLPTAHASHSGLCPEEGPASATEAVWLILKPLSCAPKTFNVDSEGKMVRQGKLMFKWIHVRMTFPEPLENGSESLKPFPFNAATWTQKQCHGRKTRRKPL